MLPEPGFGDEIGGAGDGGAGDAAEAFVEGDIDSVEEGADFCVVATVERLAFPEAGAVHVEWDRARARPFGGCDEIVPAWELAADFALRQFEQEGADRFRDGPQVFKTEGLVGRADPDTAQVV